MTKRTTKTETKTEYYYDYKCEAVINPDEVGEYARDCDGLIDSKTGICSKCGAQQEKLSYTTEHGIIWYNVEIHNGTSAKFSIVVDGSIDDDEYTKKLLAAIRRAGGRGNMVWFDGCKNPDGYDGHYGHSTGNRQMSVNGRFSVERI